MVRYDMLAPFMPLVSVPWRWDTKTDVHPMHPDNVISSRDGQCSLHISLPDNPMGTEKTMEKRIRMAATTTPMTGLMRMTMMLMMLMMLLLMMMMMTMMMLLLLL